MSNFFGGKMKNIFIVYGGNSAEHDVSVVTALSTYKRYNSKNFELQLLYIARDGNWYVGDSLDKFSFYKAVDVKKLKRVTLTMGGAGELFWVKGKKLKPLTKIDFVINCCHGGEGENGNLVALFEINKIACTSGSALSLGACMDKYFTKQVLLANGYPVLDFFKLNKEEFLPDADTLLRQMQTFGFPVVVKPVRQGSSIGVSLARDYDELKRALDLAFKFDTDAIVERAVMKKREFNVAVMCTANGLIVSEVDEPITEKTVITFEDKYLAGRESGKKLKGSASTLGMEFGERKAPQISKKLRETMKKMALELFADLNLCGVVRFDFLYDTETHKLFLGEMNAVPGSLGYYFFDEKTFLQDLIVGAENYWAKKFELKIEHYGIFK